MIKFVITEKSKVGNKKLDMANDRFFQKMQDAQAKNSTGAQADYFEPIVRHLWQKSGIAPDDFCYHSAGKADARSLKNGCLEIKTGSGIIGYTRTETISPDFCKLEKYVAYCAKPAELKTLDDVLDYTLIFTREEFIQFVATCGLKRNCGKFASGCKLGVNSSALREENKSRARGEKLHDCIMLQPVYLEDRWRACKQGKRGNYITLRVFLEQNG